MTENSIEIKFSEVLKALRKKESLKQKDLADNLNVDRSAIANYERGDRTPSLETLIIIANTFEVSLDYLIKGKSLDYKKGAGTNLISQELMAENITLMDVQLRLEEELKTKEEEIEVLKSLLKAQKKYTELLEKQQK